MFKPMFPSYWNESIGFRANQSPNFYMRRTLDGNGLKYIYWENKAWKTLSLKIFSS